MSNLWDLIYFFFKTRTKISLLQSWQKNLFLTSPFCPKQIGFYVGNNCVKQNNVKFQWNINKSSMLTQRPVEPGKRTIWKTQNRKGIWWIWLRTFQNVTLLKLSSKKASLCCLCMSHRVEAEWVTWKNYEWEAVWCALKAGLHISSLGLTHFVLKKFPKIDLLTPK